jgi:hypothetical protein
MLLDNHIILFYLPLSNYPASSSTTLKLLLMGFYKALSGAEGLETTITTVV